jgi:hypothetical protein
VTVTTEEGTSRPSLGSTFVYALDVPFMPLLPQRLLDTRAGSWLGAILSAPAAGSTTWVPVLGRAGVHEHEVSAVALSVTATESSRDLWVTVWPCGQPRPLASNLNLSGAGETAADLVLVEPGDNGSVCLYTSARTHLIVDVLGWIPAEVGFHPTQPTRLLDTRVDATTGAALPTPGPFTMVRVPARDLIAAADGTPGTVALTVTATGAVGPGWVTAWPCDAAPPTSSSLNLDRAGQTVANLVVSSLGPNGDVCLAASTATHLVADLAGWWDVDSVETLSPARLLDTRPHPLGLGWSGTTPAAGSTVEVQVAGRGGVPLTGAGTVFLNVTATGGRGAGYLTVWPCDQPKPGTSNLNLTHPGHTVAALVSSGLSASGRVCIAASTATDMVVDVTAWL